MGAPDMAWFRERAKYVATLAALGLDYDVVHQVKACGEFIELGERRVLK